VDEDWLSLDYLIAECIWDPVDDGCDDETPSRLKETLQFCSLTYFLCMPLLRNFIFFSAVSTPVSIRTARIDNFTPVM
jgi:hypothetical protein